MKANDAKRDFYKSVRFRIASALFHSASEAGADVHETCNRVGGIRLDCVLAAGIHTWNRVHCILARISRYGGSSDSSVDSCSSRAAHRARRLQSSHSTAPDHSGVESANSARSLLYSDSVPRLICTADIAQCMLNSSSTALSRDSWYYT